jgi:hypothetical protein
MVFKGFGVANWLYLGCGDGHIWTNGVFCERWSITCLARWLSGSYEDSAPVRVMCSVLSTHTHTHTQFWAMFLCLSHLSSLFISVPHFLQLLTKFWNCFAFLSIRYLYTHVVSHYIYGVVRCFAHLLPNWSLLLKPSILYSVFMHFKYCVATCLELLENFGYFHSSVESVRYFLGSTFCIHLHMMSWRKYSAYTI